MLESVIPLDRLSHDRWRVASLQQVAGCWRRQVTGDNMKRALLRVMAVEERMAELTEARHTARRRRLRPVHEWA